MFKKLKNFLLTNQNIKQTVIKNTFWLSFGNIFSRLIRGLFLIFAARFLGVNEYGVFSYVLTFAGFFTVFSDIGLNAILTREIAKQKDEEEENQFFSTIFVLKIILLIITSLILIFIAPHFSKIEKAKTIIPLMALLTLIDGIRDFSASYFRGKEKMEFDALLITSSNLTITLTGFLVLTIKPEAKTLALIYTLSSAVGMFLGLYLLKNKFKKIFNFLNKNLIPFILKSAFPIALISVIGVLMTQIDVIMLGFFKTEKEVGIYSAAQKIIILIYTLPTIIASVFFPLFSRLAQENNKELIKNVLEKALHLSLIFGLPIILGGIILSDQIIKFIYGKEFLESSLPFKILILTILPIFLGSISGNIILAYNKQQKIAKNTFIGSILNVILNILLIPLLNILGASIATLISQTIYNYLNTKTVKKEITSYSILKNAEKTILASLIMSFFALFFKYLNFHILINILFSSFIYFLSLYLLKEKMLKEVKNILKII